MTQTIDLTSFTRGGTLQNLSGKDRGLAARKEFKLDSHDETRDPVKVRIPGNVYAISTSFFCGMFGDSYKKLGDAGLREVYSFEMPDVLRPQIEQGLERCAFQVAPLTRSAD